MGSDAFLMLMVAILSLNFLINQLLDYLNLKNWKRHVPEELKDYYDNNQYLHAQNYNLAKKKLSFLSGSFNFIILLAILLVGGFGWLNNQVESYISGPIPLALAFFGVLFIASDILNTGFDLYDHFVIEEKFGFNKMTANTYILDKLKGYGLMIIFGGILGSLILWLILTLGQNFWIYAFLAVTIFSLTINLFYTDWILPLFNRLKPLEEGPLKDRIKEYARKVDFPVTDVYLMDGSKRSTKANAFFSGLGKKKKIVLFDTLIHDHTEDEVLAILAHETGHFKRKHIPRNIFLSVIQTAIMFFVLSLFAFNQNLSLALGAEEWELHLNLLAFGIIYEPVSVILGIFMNAVSRKFEYEADEFAARTADKNALISGLKKLSTKHLSNLHPHPAYTFVHYSHPPILKRIAALNSIEKKD